MPRPEDLLKMAGIGRFQVMALLQAARFYLLTGDLGKAKSWGLNRAIFYAWAKYYGPSQRYWRSIKLDELLKRQLREGAEKKSASKCPEGFQEVLGECVQVSRRGWFMIGGQEQTPQDFDKQVTSKVKRVLDWDKVWKAALEYVGSFPEWVLRNPQRFFKLVYEPIRDTFFKLLLEGGKPQPPPDIAKRIESLEKALKEVKEKQLTLTRFMSGKEKS